MASINDYLPREVLVKIFSYYMESEGPLKFLRNVSPVCKLWNDLDHSSYLWKKVSLKSLKWNSDHLLKLGERGFLKWTRTLKVSRERLTLEESKTTHHEFKIEDFLQLIDFCRNLKVLDVSSIYFTTETTLQFIARKCPEYVKFIVDSATHDCEPKYKHSKMVPIDDGNKMIMKYRLREIEEKRRLDLRSRFGHDGRIISKIADCCPLLEELHFSDMCVDNMQVKPLFPVGEIQKGCPNLRVLKIYNVNMDFSNYDDLEGLKKIRTLYVNSCDFREQEVGKIFRNSTELENLRFAFCGKLILPPAPETDYEEITFRVGEIQRECPKLRVLEIGYCNLEWTNDKELEGFKEIRKFSVDCCDTRGVDVGKILKNSTELEDLQLTECDHLELSNATEIPSEKVECLVIASLQDITEHLEKIVKKWRLTLKHLELYSVYGWCPTRVLKALLQDNQNNVIEVIVLMDYVDAPFIKSLIDNCQKLEYLEYKNKNKYGSSITLNTRKKLEDYAESLRNVLPL